MMHYAQPPPVILHITTSDNCAIRKLIRTHESHRQPTFKTISPERLRVKFPRGFDRDNQVILKQLVAELEAFPGTKVQIER